MDGRGSVARAENNAAVGCAVRTITFLKISGAHGAPYGYTVARPK